MSPAADGAGQARVHSGAGGPYSVDVRGGLGVQVGEGNTQIIYAYASGTWTDGMAPPPLASVVGHVDSPYRGLAAFGETDAPFFFGREEAAAQVLERLSQAVEGRGLLVVSGASGAGKSSLLRAGLLPRLREEGLAAAPGAASWPCLVLTPGRAPLDELAVRVALLAGVDAGAVRRELAADPAGFALAARQAALTRPPAPGRRPGSPSARGASRERLLVIVDQFEQVFTQCADEDERRAFIAALSAAADGEGFGREPTALVVLGVRADFEARCAAYPELADAVQDRYLVTAMTERQLRMAITSPARVGGSRADEELAVVLLAEVRARQPGGSGAGVLPLLSHALDQAWRSRAGNALTLADYERTGGIEGAVAASAERAYSGLAVGQQAAARQVFTRLVATSPDGADTADRASWAELTEGKAPADAADVEAVLEAFAAERLVTLAADSVEISHEALLTAWPLLRDTWLAETRADRSVRTQLRTAAAGWAAHDSDSAYLYRGTLLDAADGVAARIRSDPARNPPLSRVESSFLRASRRARHRAARLGQAAFVVLAVLALAAGSLAVWANHQRAVATERLGQAIEDQLVSNAELLRATNPSLAAELVLTAHQMDPQNQDYDWRLISTESQVLSTSESAGLGNTADSVAFSPNGKTLAAGIRSQFYDDGAVMLWSVNTPTGPRLLGQPLSIGKYNFVESVAFSPNGKILAAAVDGIGGSQIMLWDVSDPARPSQLAHPLAAGSGAAVNSVAFSPDGKTLAAGTGAAADLGGHGGVMLWDVSDPGRPSQLLATGSGAPVNSVAFSPDGKTLAAGTGVTRDPDGHGVVMLWDVSDPARPSESGQPLTADILAPVAAVAFSPNGRTLITGTAFGAQGDGNKVTLWGLPSIALAYSLTNASSVAFSPNGKILAVGTTVADGRRGGSKVMLWDVSDPARPSQLGQFLVTSNGTSVHSLAFSPNGRTLAAGISSTTGGGVVLWDVSDPDRPSQLGQPLVASSNSFVLSVAFSPDGEALAAGVVGGIMLWDVSDPARPNRLGNIRLGVVFAVAFSPDGKTLAVGTVSQVMLWDVSDPARPSQLGQPLATGNGTIADSVAFSPSGRTLAVGTGANGSYAGTDSGEVMLWDVSDPARPSQLGQPLATSSDDSDSVYSLAFSPNGEALAASAAVGGVMLWDVSDPARPSQLGQPLVASSDGSVQSVAFSPGGASLAVGTSSGPEIWNRDVDYEIRQICDSTAGDLTLQQWSQYVPQLPFDPPCSSYR